MVYSCMFILHVKGQSKVIRLFSEKGVSLTDQTDTADGVTGKSAGEDGNGVTV